MVSVFDMPADVVNLLALNSIDAFTCGDGWLLIANRHAFEWVHVPADATLAQWIEAVEGAKKRWGVL